MTKQELDATLRAAGIDSPFFDLHAVDIIGSCKYFNVRDDVQAGLYTFAGFVEAHKKLGENNRPLTFGEVRLLATQTFVEVASQTQPDENFAWADGLMN